MHQNITSMSSTNSGAWKTRCYPLAPASNPVLHFCWRMDRPATSHSPAITIQVNLARDWSDPDLTWRLLFGVDGAGAEQLARLSNFGQQLQHAFATELRRCGWTTQDEVAWSHQELI